jgi:hypothetical protein
MELRFDQVAQRILYPDMPRTGILRQFSYKSLESYSVPSLSGAHVIFHRKTGIFENSHGQTAADIAACMDRYGNHYVPPRMKQSEVAP